MFGVLTPRVDVTSAYDIHTIQQTRNESTHTYQIEFILIQYQMIATNLQENL